MKQTPETIVLVNFGCEDIQKFARSIRDRHIYTMVMPYTVPAERVMEEKPVGLILCADAGTPERPGAREKFEALKLPILWVYVLLCTDEFVKLPFVIRHYRSGRWLKNITREHLFEETA